MEKIIEYLKNNWQRASIIAGICLVTLSVGAVFLLASVRIRQFEAEPPVPGAAPETPAAEASVRTYTDLYAVSIDNHADARPVLGVNSAAFVYEMPVEGDITRFLAFFERGAEIDKIGPVRSARPYLIDWILEYGPAVFFHYGGSPEAMDKLATPAFKGINQDGISSAGASFWRDDSRSAPHNAFISSKNVGKIFESRLGSSIKVETWPMGAEAELDERGEDAQKIKIPISPSSDYAPAWVYDRAKNEYVRTAKGKVQKDAAGQAVIAKNIVTMATDINVIDAVGRLKIRTSGKGKAVVYRDGQTLNANWEVSDPSQPPRFYADDGSDIVLASGNVWIEVVKQ